MRTGSVLRTLLFLTLVCASSLSPAVFEAHAQSAEATGQTGVVRIQSPRPGSMVYIDNELVGEAPITRYLSVGAHTIRVAADGFDPDVRRVEVIADRTIDVHPQLIAGNGTVEVQCSVRGAMLVLNDQRTLPLPLRLSNFADGDYRYRIEAEGYEPEQGTFSFRRGKNILIVSRLKSSEGLVEVITRPEGARIWFNGESVGTSPLQLEDVSPGEHKIKIEHPGHASVYRLLDTSAGGKGVVELKLRSEGAAIQIQTGRTDATVTLEGIEVGTGANLRIDALNRGRYTLVVSAPDHEPAEARITVPAKGKLVWKAKLKPAGSKGGSDLSEVKPLFNRWTFWAGVGGGTVAAGTAALVVLKAIQPEPIPEGDLIVTPP